MTATCWKSSRPAGLSKQRHCIEVVPFPIRHWEGMFYPVPLAMLEQF